MNSNQSVCITLEVSNRRISCRKINHPRKSVNNVDGEFQPQLPVSQNVIAHWVDMYDAANQPIFRQYLHTELPFLTTMHKNHRKKLVKLTLPKIEGVTEVVIFEQSYPSESERTLIRNECVRVAI